MLSDQQILDLARRATKGEREALETWRALSVLSYAGGPWS